MHKLIMFFAFTLLMGCADIGNYSLYENVQDSKILKLPEDSYDMNDELTIPDVAISYNQKILDPLPPDLFKK